MESELIKGFTPIQKGGDYYDLKDFISYSTLKKIKQSPAHYKAALEEVSEVETDAMAFGSAYHCYILEPEKFETDYYIFDDHFICDTLIAEGAKSPRATKQYKEWEQSEYRLIDDRKVINKPQFEIIKDMKDVLMKHFYCRTLLAKGEAEYSITGTLHTTDGDINIKGRPDYLKRDFHFIVDLKTTNDASLDMFSKSAAENDYHIQAALYSDLMELVTGDGMSWQFFFIAQEKRKPYAFNIFCAAPAFIQQGRYEYQQLLKLYKMCLDNNKWPGYQVFCEFKSGSIDLDLPKWAMKEIKFYNHK